MFSRKRLIAGASAVALASGAVLAGAGIASAQDDDGTGSLDIGSIDIVSIGDSLSTASEALNGPVSIAPNAEGGPTVTYSNESTVAEHCLGFAAPYSTIVDNDLDTNYDEEDLEAAINLVLAIEAGGNLSHLLGDEDGAPVAVADDPEVPNNAVQNLLPIALGLPGAPSVEVEPGDDIVWTAGSPETPAIAVIACSPVEEPSMTTYTGIDPQVVADQMNEILPGGSIDSGSVNGGSVELGANLIGPFGAASSILGGDD